jgi:serine/threonine protein phosphatase PrpC
MIQFVSFYTEKKPRCGEDATPIAERLKNGECLLGVFDGLGGAGGRPFIKLDSEDEKVTGAYLASRFIRDNVLNYFKSNQINSSGFLKSIPRGVQKLQEQLATALKNYLSDLERKNPPLQIRSSMLKSLPTTMAICYITQREGVFIWAGDSRGYILNGEGLCQYTKEDLEFKGDALDNLREDSPMSNYICETGFTLQYKIFSLKNQSIIITATDGCFGYFKTPKDTDAF